MELKVEPSNILSIRPAQVRGSTEQEVLIKWKILPGFEATWELYSVIQEQCPCFHLEDKVKLLAGGIDKPLIRYTYMRRGKRQGKGSQTSRSADLAEGGGQQQGNML